MEVTKAISVVKGFAAVVVLGCLKAQIHRLGPYPLELPRPGGAVLFHALRGMCLGMAERIKEDE